MATNDFINGLYPKQKKDAEPNQIPRPLAPKRKGKRASTNACRTSPTKAHTCHAGVASARSKPQ